MVRSHDPGLAERHVRYRIDGSGRITAVNDAWERFARENGAPPALARAHVVGRSLWDFIADPTTIELYRRLVDRARGGQRVSFTFRCDSPELRRTLQMTIIAEAGGVVFETRELHIERRARPDAMDPASERIGPQLRVCGWCGRVDADGRWVDVENALDHLRVFHATVPPVTHGICEPCYHHVARDLPDAVAEAS